MNEKIKSHAAKEPQGKFEPFEFEAGELGKEEVEIKVAYAAKRVIRLFWKTILR